jgi:flagellar protein FlgJ
MDRAALQLNVPPANSPAKGAANPRLASAAHEFEASMMQELLKPLQKDLAGDGTNEDGGESNAIVGFGSEMLARAISERGGFGIATRILDRLAPAHEPQRSKDGHGGP